MENIKKIYLEITNICNLECDFCHKTKREKKLLSLLEFNEIISKIKGKSKYLYFHLMGEPLLNKNIVEFSKIAKENGFKVIITSNGYLFSEQIKEMIENKYIYKINVSVHSYSGNNNKITLKEYLDKVFSISDIALENDVTICYRLWDIIDNIENPFNDEVIKYAKEKFNGEWIKGRNGYKLNNSIKGKDNIYLEFGERFSWPDNENESINEDSFCYALRDQVGILVDGTVVPCCLDADGMLSLGNIFKEDFDTIINSEKAKYIYDSFTNHKAPFKMCETCGYIKRFSK